MMKKIFASLLGVVTLALMFSVAVMAASPKINIKGPDSAYAGDNITFTLSVDINDAELNAIELTASYDTSKLTYVSSSAKLSAWEFAEEDKGNGKLYFLCNYTDKALNADVTLIKLTFKVDKNAKKDDKVTVALKDVTLTSLQEEYTSSDVSSTVTVKEKSSDCTLRSLSIDGVKLSPEFSSKVTAYTAEFEYRTEKLSISAKANDSAASVEISGNRSFKEGKNTITIKVTAEDGTEKKYVITATMGANPNPPKDSENRISSITLSSGVLDGEFSPDVYEYTVNVGDDVASVVITPTPASSKAKCDMIRADLTEAQTQVKVICIAEDGSEAEYVFTFIKSVQTGEVTTDDVVTDTITGEIPDDTTCTDTNDVYTQGITEEIDEDTVGDTTASQTKDEGEKTGINKPVPMWVVLVCSVISLALGAAVSAIIFKRKF